MRKFKSGDRIQVWVVPGAAVLVALAAFYVADGIASRQTAVAVALVGGMFLVKSWSIARVWRQREEHLRYHALHDPLTGLPNRSLFVERLEGALFRAVRKSGSIAVLLVDLDDFEEIDHGFGHNAGDDLLKIAARRLEASESTVARLCGESSLPCLRTYPTRSRQSPRRSVSGRH